MKIFFDHLPKTAGTSMHQFFVEAVGAASVSNIIKNMPPAAAVATYAGKDVITGHFNFLPGEQLPVGYVSATVLRDPRERALSVYFFLKNDVPELMLNEDEMALRSMSLAEALWDDFFVRQISNTQSTHFASFFHPHPEALSPTEMFDLAVRGLQQYDLVGVTERLDEFSAAFSRILDLPPSTSLKRLNITSDRLAFKDLPSRLQARIEELTEVDQRLWAFAATAFPSKHSRAERIGSPSSARTEFNGDSAQPIPASVTTADGVFELIEARLVGKIRPSAEFISGELADLHITFRCNEAIDDITLGYAIHHDSGLHMFGVNTRLLGHHISVPGGGPYHVAFSFPMNLGVGVYHVGLTAHTGLSHLERCYMLKPRALSFTVVGYMDVVFEGLVNLVPSLSITAAEINGTHLLNVLSDTPKFKVIGQLTPRVLNPQGAIRILASIETVEAGSQMTLPVAITNYSDVHWISAGTNPVLISYHWRRPDGTTQIENGVRTPLPQGMVCAGTTVNGAALVECPMEEGSYSLQLTLVQEGECWFEDRGFNAASVAVVVGVRRASR